MEMRKLTDRELAELLEWTRALVLAAIDGECPGANMAFAGNNLKHAVRQLRERKPLEERLFTIMN